MATVLYGTPIDEIRGSIGGVTFSNGLGGPIARVRTIPRNPPTPNNIPVRTAVTVALERWRNDLTAANRTDWNTKAAATPLTNSLGQTYYASGLNWYTRAYTCGQKCAQLTTDAPPSTLTKPILDVVIVWTEGTGIRVTGVNGPAPESGEWALGWCARAVSTGITTLYPPYPWFQATDIDPPPWPWTVIPQAECIRQTNYWFAIRRWRYNGRTSTIEYHVVYVPPAP